MGRGRWSFVVFLGSSKQKGRSYATFFALPVCHREPLVYNRSQSGKPNGVGRERGNHAIHEDRPGGRPRPSIFRSAWSQTVSGSIAGIVLDSTQAAVANAKVTAVEQNKKLSTRRRPM